MSVFSFGEWLKRQRKASGLTQEQLAQQISCSTITLRKMEAEERRPSEQIAERLAQIFNIPHDEQKAFLRFARGNNSSAPTELTKATPWHMPNAPVRVNLPAMVAALIGRDQDIARVREYLSNPNTRIVTFVGSPGIGKTRLSIESARELLPDFPDGVFFVALAPLDNPSLIAPSIVQSLGFVEAKAQSPIKQLTDGIGDKHLLLVLDNCEHLIEDIAPLASELLSACSRLKIIATSRESLRVPGEWLYAVPALDVPKETVDIETASQFPALVLFSERARAVRSDFILNKENIQAVASICGQLDGLPLAIELIATRIRLMSPQALLERMTDSFILSADGMRAVSARQKTLNNAIGWSYNFLSPDEQRLFACLSIFSGGFAMIAAETVLSRMFAGKSVPDLIAKLSDKSMLQRAQNERSEVRFDMLVTIQQFALEHLRRSGEEPQARDAHLEYLVDFVEKSEGEIRCQNQAEWIDRVEDEYTNIRTALEWAVSNQKTEPALRLLAALGWHWEIQARYREAHNWLNRIRTLPNVNQYPLLHARVLSHIGRYSWTQGSFDEARVVLVESLALTSQLGAEGETCLADASNWLGLLAIFQDKDYKRARSLLDHALKLYKKNGNAWGIALSAFHLGLLEYDSDHPDKAFTLIERALFAFQQLGDLFFISRTSLFLGYLHLNQERYDKARFYFEEQLWIDTELQFWNGIADGWRNMGALYEKQGDMQLTAECYEKSRQVRREHGLSNSSGA